MSTDNLTSEAVEEVDTPPSSPTPLPPEIPEPLGEDSNDDSSFPQIPLSPNIEEEEIGPEPTTSTQDPEKEKIDIPATWLQVEDLWLNLYVEDEPTALNVALDSVKQWQNMSK